MLTSFCFFGFFGFHLFVCFVSCNRGEVYFHMMDYEKAVADFEVALNLQPECARALFYKVCKMTHINAHISAFACIIHASSHIHKKVQILHMLLLSFSQ